MSDTVAHLAGTDDADSLDFGDWNAASIGHV